MWKLFYWQCGTEAAYIFSNSAQYETYLLFIYFSMHVWERVRWVCTCECVVETCVQQHAMKSGDNLQKMSFLTTWIPRIKLRFSGLTKVPLLTKLSHGPYQFINSTPKNWSNRNYYFCLVKSSLGLHNDQWNFNSKVRLARWSTTTLFHSEQLVGVL